MLENLSDNLSRLIRYIEAKNYRGYDIYDGLKITSFAPVLNNYYANTFLTQFFKISPFNLRPWVGISETTMPKGMGLILQAYSFLAQSRQNKSAAEKHSAKAEAIFNWLVEQALKTYSGYCWNFGFNYKFMFDKPTIVITSIIARALHEYYLATNSAPARQYLIGIEDFILKDLHLTETRKGLCFSYTPIKKDCCYNASMLAAETLARIYAVAPKAALLDFIGKAVDFTLAYQKPDGSWNYSVDISTGIERKQIDFHQGYILESLYEIIKLTDLREPKYIKGLKAGAAFYRNKQFFQTGQAIWRYPRVWPVDIHNQAQGIITFSKLGALDHAYPEFAKTIAAWTIDNMQDRSGYFYYRQYRFFKNKIPYMRWAQAWMMVALTTLLLQTEQHEHSFSPRPSGALSSLQERHPEFEE